MTFEMLHKAALEAKSPQEYYEVLKQIWGLPGLTKAPQGISRKTTGQLIDELITTSMKCWHAQEVVCGSGDPAEVAQAAKDAQKLNARRCALMQAIDGRMGEAGTTVTNKTYE